QPAAMSQADHQKLVASIGDVFAILETMASAVEELRTDLADGRQETAELRQEFNKFSEDIGFAIADIPSKIKLPPAPQAQPTTPAGTRLGTNQALPSTMDRILDESRVQREIAEALPVRRGVWTSGNPARFYLDADEVKEEYAKACAAMPEGLFTVQMPTLSPGWAFVHLDSKSRGGVARNKDGSVRDATVAKELDLRKYQAKLDQEAAGRTLSGTGAPKATTSPKPATTTAS
ncbi:MAG: hypothetical protein Q4C03_04505, partial [bacterium]|nr:hypothetical protein [bacterium]